VTPQGVTEGTSYEDGQRRGQSKTVLIEHTVSTP